MIGTQFAQHAPYGGVVPEIAARAHVETIDAVTAEAMQGAGLAYDALSGVAATAGPGLVGGVMVGLSFGKAVAATPDKASYVRPAPCIASAVTASMVSTWARAAISGTTPP